MCARLHRVGQVRKRLKHTCTSQPAARVSHQMEGIIEIGANQADGVDPVPPQTVANLNVKLQCKLDEVEE